MVPDAGPDADAYSRSDPTTAGDGDPGPGDEGPPPAEADPGTDGDPTDDDGPGRYSLIWRSLRTALGSDSYLLRSYALVGGLVATFVALLVALAFPQWVLATVSGSGTATFSRAFLLLSGLVVVVPLLAPPVLAARRHRQGIATRRGDATLALSGYLFVASLYVALLVSATPETRETPPAAVAPVVEFLYGLDPALGVAFPVAAVAVMVGVARTV